jgi:hypothetical protein
MWDQIRAKSVGLILPLPGPKEVETSLLVHEDAKLLPLHRPAPVHVHLYSIEFTVYSVRP